MPDRRPKSRWNNLRLIDASVLSASWHRRAYKSSVADWLDNQDESSLVIPSIVFEVIDYGINRVKGCQPEHAAELNAWRAQRKQTCFEYSLNAYGRAVLRHLKTFKELNNLWRDDPRRPSPRIPQTLVVAASSVALGLPINTAGPRSYMAVHELLPLPGCFDVLTGNWVISPRDQGKIPSPFRTISRYQVDPLGIAEP